MASRFHITTTSHGQWDGPGGLDQSELLTPWNSAIVPRLGERDPRKRRRSMALCWRLDDPVWGDIAAPCST